MIMNPVGEQVIENNTITSNTGIYYGGGFLIMHYDISSVGAARGEMGNVTIKGNTITQNKVKTYTGSTSYHAYGGGAAVVDTETSHTAPVKVIFSDNTIDQNVAGDSLYEGEINGKPVKNRGGGLSLCGYADDLEYDILSGSISDNKAMWGGGIDYTFKQTTVLRLYNALLTDNTASRGGGVWACPTSQLNMYLTFGGAIYDNTAVGTVTYDGVATGPSGDDIRYEGVDSDIYEYINSDYPSPILSEASVNARALGGYLMDWYSDDVDARFMDGDGEPVDVLKEYKNREESFGLHGELSDTGKTLANEDAKLVISNNAATVYGGGIATNGIVDFGEDTSMTVTAQKIWTDAKGEIIETGLPVEKVEITLIRVDEEGSEVDLETVTLSGENDWTHVFEDLSTDYTYEVREETVVSGYDPNYLVEKDGEGNALITVVNSYREYYDIDEEIVVDENDRDTWVKAESVNEYNAIELEMSTCLPTVPGDEIQYGNFTMNFHDVLDSALILDEADADFKVVIGHTVIDHKYYVVTISPDDGCSFHVDVDLTALYQDGVITEDDLQGETEILIFFYADLEGTGLNGSYKSTVWYEIYDGETWLYTSSEDVVEVYTYEIVIRKYDETTLTEKDYESAAMLEGAVFGVYEDEDCEKAVGRNGEAYTVTTDESGTAIFYGLAEGTYFVEELKAPEGYAISDEIVKVVLDSDMDGYEYVIWFADVPTLTEEEIPENGDDNDSEKEPSGIAPADEANPPAGTSPDARAARGGKTGDPYHSTFWIVVLCAAGACIAFLAVYRRQKKLGSHTR